MATGAIGPIGCTGAIGPVGCTGPGGYFYGDYCDEISDENGNKVSFNHTKKILTIEDDFRVCSLIVLRNIMSKQTIVSKTAHIGDAVYILSDLKWGPFIFSIPSYLTTIKEEYKSIETEELTKSTKIMEQLATELNKLAELKAFW